LTSNQFYVPRIEDGAARITLEGEEHHHLTKSARVRKGKTIRLFDGEGRRVLARVESVGRDRTIVAVLERDSSEGAGPGLVLAQAIVPAKKMEFILEKASEIGISAFVPLETNRSLRASEERSERKAERWARIAREAAKQSKGTTIPAIHPPRRLRDWLGSPGEGRRIFLSERGGTPLRDILLDPENPARSAAPAAAVVAIGPTGGWTESEERDLREAGFEAASLGARILKSETAALAAVAMIAHFWGP
jgi:16S rRNA (uracil1498-N3)-methyltransferase